mmetsp:Transcript_24730/g.52407  ORF Transcript_24730/g.52407 Transcript_24730/m.52407 type:complete len:210 (+) Transcript_24730:3809-4438(+)
MKIYDHVFFVQFHFFGVVIDLAFQGIESLLRGMKDTKLVEQFVSFIGLFDLGQGFLHRFLVHVNVKNEIKIQVQLFHFEWIEFNDKSAGGFLDKAGVRHQVTSVVSILQTLAAQVFALIVAHMERLSRLNVAMSVDDELEGFGFGVRSFVVVVVVVVIVVVIVIVWIFLDQRLKSVAAGHHLDGFIRFDVYKLGLDILPRSVAVWNHVK